MATQRTQNFLVTICITKQEAHGWELLLTLNKEGFPMILNQSLLNLSNYPQHRRVWFEVCLTKASSGYFPDIGKLKMLSSLGYPDVLKINYFPVF